MAEVIRKPGPGKAQLEAMLQNLRGASVKVGFFEDHQYDNGTPMASVAVWIEFGTKTSPPRPVFRITVREHQEDWRKLVRLLSKKVATGELSVRQVMEQLGNAAAGHLATAISELTDPPLAEATIKNRMSRKKNKDTVGNLDKPLIDTGLLFAGVTFQVTGGGAE